MVAAPDPLVDELSGQDIQVVPVQDGVLLLQLQPLPVGAPEPPTEELAGQTTQVVPVQDGVLLLQLQLSILKPSVNCQVPVKSPVP